MAVAIAVVAALAVGILAITVFPNGLSTDQRTSTATNATTTGPLTPKPLTGELSAQDVSCSLASGVCTFTIANNSTTPLDLETCQMQVVASVNVTSTTTYATISPTTTYTAIAGSSTTHTNTTTPTVAGGQSTATATSTASSSVATVTITEYMIVNGTIGGPASAGVPANSKVNATCTIPTTQLGHETGGSVADGGFTVKLVDSADSYPAGTETTFSFEGTWS